MRSYIMPVIIFLLLFISINAQMSGFAFPGFAYVFCGIILVYGIAAHRHHKPVYVKSMLAVAIVIQLIFFLAIPTWVLQNGMPLNAAWPYFPELLWSAGTLVAWYYIISFLFLPIIVFFFGRRAWCSYICGTGVMAETLGDRYRQNGPKASGIPSVFGVFKWVILIGTVVFTVAALNGNPNGNPLSVIFLVVFILFLRTFLMQAVNIVLMPKFGTRIWCKYFCPQGVLLGVISRWGRFALVRNESLCVGCGTCNKNCSMSIDINGGPTVNRTGDCVGCGVCVEVCPNQALTITTNQSVINNINKIPQDGPGLNKPN